jgi:hypothetical protein
MHDGVSTLLSLLHADDAALPPPLLRAMRWLAADQPSAKQERAPPTSAKAWHATATPGSL